MAMSAPPLLRCAILGMGKAGRSLALSLLAHGVPLHACFTRYATKSASLRGQLGDSFSIHHDLIAFSAALAEQVDILFVAVPDDFISAVADTLVSCPGLPPHIAHLSGAQSYEALKPLETRAGIAQFHLLASLAGEAPIPHQALAGICANQGETERLLMNLAKQIDLSPALLPKGQQALYHAAAVLTGNLSLALVAQSAALMESAGIEAETARKGLARLLASASQAIERAPLADALTGPLARGDLQTLSRNLGSLEPHTESAQLYKVLSAYLLDVSKAEPDRKQAMRQLFW